jgi:hypothetical protein
MDKLQRGTMLTTLVKRISMLGRQFVEARAHSRRAGQMCQDVAVSIM